MFIATKIKSMKLIAWIEIIHNVSKFFALSISFARFFKRSNKCSMKVLTNLSANIKNTKVNKIFSIVDHFSPFKNSNISKRPPYIFLNYIKNKSLDTQKIKSKD